MNEAQRWAEFGRYLVEQRERLGINRRDAAKKAKLTTTEWRDLEAGHKEIHGGVRVLPNPGPEVIERVAKALQIPPDELLKHVGRVNSSRAGVTKKATSDAATRLVQKVVRLNERDRRLVEHLVNEMLEET